MPISKHCNLISYKMLLMLEPRCTDCHVARTITRVNGITHGILAQALGRARRLGTKFGNTSRALTGQLGELQGLV